MRLKAGVLATACLLLLVACATVPAAVKPIPNPPNLVGKWKGEWGGNMVHPMEMVVDRQREGVVGGWIIFPGPTHRLRGTVGAAPDGSVWVLLVDVGGREFPLKVVSEKRLEGTGRSHGHFGPVTLTRE